MMYGNTTARAAVILALSEPLSYFNVAESMSDVQMAVTTDLIIEEYPYFKMDDLKLCFKNAMKGEYGRVYNRIDGQMVLLWLKQYNIDRCTLADEISYNEHKQIASNSDEEISYQEYLAELSKRAKAGSVESQHALEVSNRINNQLRDKSLNQRKEDLEKFYNSR